jgi:Protein of unknown function (DUF1580)
MNDLMGEGLITLAEAAAHFPGARGAARVNPSTLFRWCKKGTRASDGRVVRLEFVRAGCRLLTSKPALSRYLAALSTACTSGIPVTAVRTPAERARRAAEAADALRKIGA